MTNSIEKQKMIVNLSKKKGANFIGIHNYTNAKGDVAHYLIISGYSYANAKAHDLETLQGVTPESLADEISCELGMVTEAIAKLTKSLTSPDQARSEGQTNAYVHLTSGVKQHIETGKLYITGLESKRIPVSYGDGKRSEKGAMVIVQDKIKDYLDLRMGKIRNFVLEGGEYAIRGQKL